MIFDLLIHILIQIISIKQATISNKWCFSGSTRMPVTLWDALCNTRPSPTQNSTRTDLATHQASSTTPWMKGTTKSCGLYLHHLASLGDTNGRQATSLPASLTNQWSDMFFAMDMFNLGNVWAQLDFLQKVSYVKLSSKHQQSPLRSSLGTKKSDVSSDQWPLFFLLFTGVLLPSQKYG